MKLSMSLIAEYLAPYQPECHILNDTQTITGIRFFSDKDTHFSREHVYLGSADGYFQDPRYKNALLLANGQNQILCPGADYEDLLNDVLSAFDYYRDLEQQLLLSATKRSSLADFIPLIESAVSDPFLVFDLNGKLLACANRKHILDEALKENLLHKSSLGSDIIARKFVKKEGELSHDLTDYPQFLHAEGFIDLGSVAMYITWQDEHVGFVLFLPSTMQKASAAMALVPLFVQAISMSAEFTDKNSLHQSPRSILLRLLEQEMLSDTILTTLQHQLPTTDAVSVIVCKSISIQNYTHRHLLIQEIEHFPVKTVCCDFQEYVVILLAIRDQSTILNLIRQAVAEKTIAIGVSMPVFDLHLVFSAYTQALLALTSSSEAGTRYCKDLALPYLLHTIYEKETASHLLHPVCFQLTKTDLESHSELYPTLEAFLFHKMSRTETARYLHIHLNTLKYRLNKIEELCDIDLNDPDDLFYLQLSFAIRKQYQGNQ